MNRIVTRHWYRIIFLLLSVATWNAYAEPQPPALSAEELEKRCGAARRDVRTFCEPDLRYRGWRRPSNRFDFHTAQLAQSAPPTPGSQRPRLPRSDQSYACLDARLRIDQYCYPKNTPTGEALLEIPETTGATPGRPTNLSFWTNPHPFAQTPGAPPPRSD
jgi:hypothetical protein